jgi:hypothetical protein
MIETDQRSLEMVDTDHPNFRLAVSVSIMSMEPLCHEYGLVIYLSWNKDDGGKLWENDFSGNTTETVSVPQPKIGVYYISKPIEQLVQPIARQFAEDPNRLYVKFDLKITVLPYDPKFHWFPFDSQTVPILFFFPNLKNTQSKFVPQTLADTEAMFGIKAAPDTTLNPYPCLKIKYLSNDYHISTWERFTPPLSLEAKCYYVSYWMGVTLQRDLNYYFWFIFAINYIIVSAACAIKPLSVKDTNRLIILVTLLVALTTFKFVIMNWTPRVDHLTFLDCYILISFGVVALLILEWVMLIGKTNAASVDSTFIWCLWGAWTAFNLCICIGYAKTLCNNCVSMLFYDFDEPLQEGKRESKSIIKKESKKESNKESTNETEKENKNETKEDTLPI